MEKMRNATPEERRNMRLEGFVEMTARNYELNDSEKGVVRQEMLKMRDERRAQMGTDAEEYDRLRDQMFEYWNRPRPGGENENRDGPPDFRRMREDPEFQKMQERMRALDEKYPFDWQTSMQRVEALLPADKVAKGRARFEERRAQWQNRGGNGDSGRGRERGDDNRRRRRDRGPDRNDMPPQPKAEAAKVEPMRAGATALHPWEEYVNKFVAQYGLSETQKASAKAILKDCLARESKLNEDPAIRRAKADAANATDSAAARAKMAEANGPRDRLFEELKGRLDALLTAEQRGK